MNIKNTSNKPYVAIIILNWNGWKDTIECLESIFKNNYPNYQIIVIDNASTNNSMNKIKEWAEGKQEIISPVQENPLHYLSHPPHKKPIPYLYCNSKEIETDAFLLSAQNIKYPLVLVQSEENLGFAKGNNIGLRYSLNKKIFDFAWLLNNDTVILKDTLEALVNIMTDYPEFGVITPRINHYYNINRIWNSGGMLTLTGNKYYFEHNQVIPNNKRKNTLIKTTFITGCAMFLRRSIIEKYGILTENFFMGEEDYEFSLRMKRKNIKMACDRSTTIYHKIGQSRDEKNHNTINSIFIHQLNRFINLKNNYNEIYWNLWRFMAVLRVFYILYFKHKYSITICFKYCRKLIDYSNKYNTVTKELYFKLKEECFN
jgi:hypothetical protein